MKAPDAKPSKIEVEFKFEDRYYAYGVEFTIQGIQEEWLFEINERTEKKVFSRESNAAKVFDFGTLKLNADAKGFLNIWVRALLPRKVFCPSTTTETGKILIPSRRPTPGLPMSCESFSPSPDFRGCLSKSKKTTSSGNRLTVS